MKLDSRRRSRSWFLIVPEPDALARILPELQTLSRSKRQDVYRDAVSQCGWWIRNQFAVAMLFGVISSLTIGTVVEALVPLNWLFHVISVLLLMNLTLLANWALQTLARPTVQQIIRTRLSTHCDSCGYELTGNASGVCPECGRKVGL
ncbi:MAG: hypothetical protein AAF561_10360 [Planctomycetota bacterium]